jgi:uncharacterized protein (TIGR03086 family)
MTRVALLERAAGYALGAAETVTPELLSRPTPCRDWNLRMLLEHACESVAALLEGLDAGRIGLYPAIQYRTPADPARILRERVTRLLDALSAEDRHAHVIDVADQRLPDSVLADVAALEIAIHGWDISQASGHHRPLPPELAVDLLAISPLLVPDGNRHPLFASPVYVSATAHPSQRLLAYLGRTDPPFCSQETVSCR